MLAAQTRHPRSDLGAFLRARRDRLTPAQAGVPAFPGARRVPGLRREELAVAAGLSLDYYSRLEQGRQATVSQDVLAALARALRLDEIETEHLRQLATPSRLPARQTDRSQLPDPGLLRLMTTLDHVPALLLGYRGDVLARNTLLSAVLGRPLSEGSSFLRYLFLDSLARDRIINWSDFARPAVATLRRETGRRPNDSALNALVGQLRVSDPQVALWWEDNAVRDYASVAKRIQHPDAGELQFDVEIVAAPHNPDQRLVIYTAQPDSPTAHMLPILASWGEQLTSEDDHVGPLL